VRLPARAHQAGTHACRGGELWLGQDADEWAHGAGKVSLFLFLICFSHSNS
jgi:hypothetical protein